MLYLFLAALAHTLWPSSDPMACVRYFPGENVAAVSPFGGGGRVCAILQSGKVCVSDGKKFVVLREGTDDLLGADDSIRATPSREYVLVPSGTSAAFLLT